MRLLFKEEGGGEDDDMESETDSETISYHAPDPVNSSGAMLMSSAPPSPEVPHAAEVSSGSLAGTHEFSPLCQPSPGKFLFVNNLRQSDF